MLTERDIEKVRKMLERIKHLRITYDQMSDGGNVSVLVGGKPFEVSHDFDKKVRGFVTMEVGKVIGSLTDELVSLGVEAPQWTVGGANRVLPRTTTMMKPKSLPESGFYKDEDDD